MVLDRTETDGRQVKRKTQDQRHGPVRVYTPEEVAAFVVSPETERKIAAARLAAGRYERPWRVLLRTESGTVERLVMARSHGEAATTVRESEPSADVIDAYPINNAKVG